MRSGALNGAAVTLATPFITAVGTSKAQAVFHEWQTDTLAAASTSNAQLEGDIVSLASTPATTRTGNYCQIFRKTVSVTGTQETVNKAGRDSELAYQKAKRGKELLRDIEATVLTNQGHNSGNATTARTLRSMNSWLSTNTNRNSIGSSGASGTSGADASAGSVGATDANAGREFSETLLKNVLQSCFTNGGEPTMLLVGPYNKTVVSGFTGRSQARQMIDKERIQGAAALYASDYGDLKVIPNRFQRERDAWLVDPDYAAVAYLRRIRYQDLAKVADSMDGFMVGELTLVVKNEAAHGLVADLTTQTSAV